MHSFTEYVDAVKARDYITGSQTKRSQSINVVRMYARDMLAGEWRLIHSGLAFRDPEPGEIASSHGVLVDGPPPQLPRRLPGGRHDPGVITFGSGTAAPGASWPLARTLVHKTFARANLSRAGAMAETRTRTGPEPGPPHPEPETGPPLAVPPARDAKTWEPVTAPPPRLPDAELARRMAAAFPESMGPGTDTESGEVLYGQPPSPHIGRIPLQRSMEEVWAERARQEAEAAAVPPEVRAAEALIREEMRTGRRF